MPTLAGLQEQMLDTAAMFSMVSAKLHEAAQRGDMTSVERVADTLVGCALLLRDGQGEDPDCC